MNTKLLNKIKSELNNNCFDIVFESQMVQSRIISSFLEVIESKNFTQKDLEDLTGLTQPFLSGLFNNRKKLNVEHIARLQNALNIVLQPPKYLSVEEHHNTYYQEDEYLGLSKMNEFFKKEIESICRNRHLINDNNSYSKEKIFQTKKTSVKKTEQYDYA
ncbi:helix-turn-helix domain-containing protein [Flavobacterium facile]|uniref:helix-turn-helix domain-containing protein n=1 Tax=Flavobacterium facile TaxID=2893174 RepID=UPI002E77D155|nr:helix-turn-helix transcriptional regulator [Flavobacterium sp. T-12]